MMHTPRAVAAVAERLRSASSATDRAMSRADRFLQAPPVGRVWRALRAAVAVAFLFGSFVPRVLPIGVGTIFAIMLIPMVAFALLRRPTRVHPLIPLALVVFSIPLVHAIFINPVTAYGQEKLVGWVTFTLAAAFAAALIWDDETLVAFCAAWILGAVVLAVMAIVTYRGGQDTVFASNPIWVARALAVALIMIGWLLWNRRGSRVALAVSVLAIAVALIFLGSRGPIVGAVAGLLVFALLSGTRPLLRGALVLGGAALGFVAVTALSAFLPTRFIELIRDGRLIDPSREALWGVSLPIIPQHAWGVGFGNWAVSLDSPIKTDYPHNVFIEVVIEFGWLIGAAFLVLIVVVLVMLVRRARASRSIVLVASVLVAETVFILFSGDLNARSFFFFLFLGALTASRIDKSPADIDLGVSTNKTLPHG